MSLFSGTDFERFLEIDNHNREVAVQFLKEQDYWKYFAQASTFYADLVKSIRAETLSKKSLAARHFLFKGCLINLFKAVRNISSGHISDSNIFVRKTLEAQKTALFFRENPHSGELWFETIDRKKRKIFESQLKKWHGDFGHIFLKAEMPYAHSSFGFASHLGPHANFALTLIQNSKEVLLDTIELRVNFHELEEGPRGNLILANHFFWILSCHWEGAFWWLEKSGLAFDTTEDLLKFWRNCYLNFKVDLKKIGVLMTEANKRSSK